MIGALIVRSNFITSPTGLGFRVPLRPGLRSRCAVAARRDTRPLREAPDRDTREHSSPGHAGRPSLHFTGGRGVVVCRSADQVATDYLVRPLLLRLAGVRRDDQPDNQGQHDTYGNEYGYGHRRVAGLACVPLSDGVSAARAGRRYPGLVSRTNPLWPAGSLILSRSMVRSPS